jgi:hypothetical protein
MYVCINCICRLYVLLFINGTAENLLWREVHFYVIIAFSTSKQKANKEKREDFSLVHHNVYNVHLQYCRRQKTRATYKNCVYNWMMSPSFTKSLHGLKKYLNKWKCSTQKPIQDKYRPNYQVLQDLLVAKDFPAGYW